MSAVEPAFAEKQALFWTSVDESGMVARRGVEFVRVLESGNEALVRYNLATYTARLEDLVPMAPPPPSFWTGGKWLEVPKPPPIPTSEALQAQLIERRTALRQAQEAVKTAQGVVETAKEIARRADREVEQARAALATLDRHDAAALAGLTAALRENREPPAVRNGAADRDYVQQHLDRAEAAAATLAGELVQAQTALATASAGLQTAVRAVLSTLLTRKAEALRRCEERCALQRLEITKCSEWWPTSGGHLTLPPATADFIAVQPHWAELPACREAREVLGPWKRLQTRLLEQADADFEPEKREE